MTEEGDLLYEPSAERRARAAMTRFSGVAEKATGRSFPGYHDLWEWSVTDLAGFWSALAEFCEVPFRTAPEEIVVPGRGPDGGESVEHSHFFVGAELNYLDVVARHDPASLAVVALEESGRRRQLTYGELLALAGRVEAGLRRHGVTTGARVAAVLPNGLEAVACFLASASLGAVWSSCAPEFGAASMVDRFRQIEPTVVVTVDAYLYGGRRFDLSDKLGALAGALPGATVLSFDELVASGSDEECSRVAVGFEHPLWVLYSSGTTGLPKAIVQGHGGIVLEHLKALVLHHDLGPGSRFFWFSTTGWMMWNYLVGGLLTGATIVCYDGSPVFPDPLRLFEMASSEKVSLFGTSAPFLEACRKTGRRPRDEFDLSQLEAIGSTGAPLSPEGFSWAAEAVGDDVAVASASGGTDVCTAFLTACPVLPVHAGELQCAALGAAAEAFDGSGRPVTGEVGELVLTAPMPSMPVSLWGDADGSRLHDAYFARFPGVWTHGDWVKRTERDTYVVYGRSDATLNRGGVRMGTSEFYRAVETAPGVADCLVVDTSELGREGELLLLVVPTGELEPAALEASLRATIREQLSPRHVPDRVLPVPALPRTLNGKKVEVPIRRILLGTPVERAVSTDSLSDPAALDGLLEALRAAGLLSEA